MGEAGYTDTRVELMKKDERKEKVKMGRVEGKVAVVTGGAVGIGRATCLLLAKEGAKVAVTDVLDKEGEEVGGEIKGFGGVAKFWHLDVTNEQEVEKVFAAIFGEFGKIDVLVNNAGIAGVSKPTHEITEAEWDKVMAVNVKGVFFCTKHAIPYMRQAGGGSIINLSSIYGIISAPDVPPYHASKGAVRLMTKTDALFYARDNIRVNSVHPGFIWTPMVENYLKSSGIDPEEGREQLASLHPIGHVGEPDDIAYGILYLASDESKFVTGSELVIDGGYTAR
ncbi:SDR family NAD(P)-dependent oxidoreductase [Thermodesulfitimonas autotrophica]|nr:glucose 1-dehydrogenase [Thermodesulfitimonas autotrophica]